MGYLKHWKMRKKELRVPTDTRLPAESELHKFFKVKATSIEKALGVIDKAIGKGDVKKLRQGIRQYKNEVFMLAGRIDKDVPDLMASADPAAGKRLMQFAMIQAETGKIQTSLNKVLTEMQKGDRINHLPVRAFYGDFKSEIKRFENKTGTKKSKATVDSKKYVECLKKLDHAAQNDDVEGYVKVHKAYKNHKATHEALVKNLKRGAEKNSQKQMKDSLGSILTLMGTIDTRVEITLDSSNKIVHRRAKWVSGKVPGL